MAEAPCCERCGAGIRPDVLKTVRGMHYHAICEPLDATPAEIAETEAANAELRETWPKTDTAVLSRTPFGIAVQALVEIEALEKGQA